MLTKPHVSAARLVWKIGLVAGGVILPAAVPAQPLPPDVEVAETLLHLIGGEALFLPAAFGPSAGALAFTATTDPVQRTFSYFLAAGQSYGGSAVTMSSAGGFNAATVQYEWSGVGQLGSEAWTSTGTAAWSPAATTAGARPAADPPPPPPPPRVGDPLAGQGGIMRNGELWLWVGTATVTGVNPYTSSGAASTGPVLGSGQIVRAAVTDVGTPQPDGRVKWMWTLKVTAPPPGVNPFEERITWTQESGNPGEGTIEFAVLPEPQSVILLLAGLSVWGLTVRRRRANGREAVASAGESAHDTAS